MDVRSIEAPRRCLTCGGAIDQQHGRGRPKKYCSPECRVAAPEETRSKFTRVANIPLVCQYCDEPFMAVRTGVMYCSKACKAAAKTASGAHLKPGSHWREVEGSTGCCATCGGAFEITTFNRKYCSKACQKERRLEVDLQCLNCGKTYNPKRAERSKCCSRKCGFEYQAKVGAERKAASDERHRMEVEERRVERLARRYDCTCEECGEPFGGRSAKSRFCSDTCGSRNVNKRKTVADRVPRPCKCCGKAFAPEYGSKRRDYCSKKCARKAAAKISKPKRRARMRGAEAESVDPIKVFERDNWRCHICGTKTPKKLRGTIDDRAPELDHVLPLAAGGAHTYANTACACRKCNREKGAKPLGQIPFLFAALPISQIPEILNIP